MKFSIITASIQRESLVKCCESVDRQTFADWEHLIWVDKEVDWISAQELNGKRFYFSDGRHGDYGNTPRNRAWLRATGDWVIVLDDDNFFLRPDALSIIARTLNKSVGVNIYPILRFGHEFSGVPPKVCHVDSANAVFRRDVGPWPIGPEYTMDGIFIERVANEHGWSSHSTAPLISVPVQGKGL